MAWQQHKCTMAFSMQQSFCFIRPPSNHQHRRRQPNKQPPARAYMPRSGHLAADLLGRPCPRGRATRAVQAAVSANSNNGSELFIGAKNNTIQDTKLPRCKFSLQLSRSLGIRSAQCLILIFVAKSREGKFFEVEMTVRDCELDKYRVVSSAVLAAYMETGQLRPSSSNSYFIREGRLGCLCRVSC